MQIIKEISHLDPKIEELLRYSGYISTGDLGGKEINQVIAHLSEENESANIFEPTPSFEDFEKLLSPLNSEIASLLKPSTSKKAEVILRDKELLNASFAIPLSSSFIKTKELNVNDLPAGKALVTMKDEVESSEDLPGGLESGSDEVLGKEPLEEDAIFFEDIDHENEDSDWIEADELIDKENIVSTDIFNEEGGSVEPLEGGSVEPLERGAMGSLISSVRKETNEGVSPDSKRYIQGVLLQYRGSFWFGLSSYLGLLCCLTGLCVSILLVLLDRLTYSWALYSLAACFVFCLIFLSFAGISSCPVCKQKQFLPKRIPKNKKAHKIPFLSRTLTTAIHALLFKWFRCLYCGTALRLKE